MPKKRGKGKGVKRRCGGGAERGGHPLFKGGVPATEKKKEGKL